MSRHLARRGRLGRSPRADRSPWHPVLEIGAYSEHFPSVGCCSVLHISGRILVRILTDSVSVAGNNSIRIGEAALYSHALNRWHENAVLQALGLLLVPVPTPHAGGL